MCQIYHVFVIFGLLPISWIYRLIVMVDSRISPKVPSVIAIRKITRYLLIFRQHHHQWKQKVNTANLGKLFYRNVFEHIVEKIELAFSKYKCMQLKLSMIRNMVAQWARHRVELSFLFTHIA